MMSSLSSFNYFNLEPLIKSDTLAQTNQVPTHHSSKPYLIFVIFFTRTKFLENKIYTEKKRKLRQNTQKIANFLRYYGKIHSKLTIFRVKSVKIYTGQKKFTRTCSWGLWQISGMDEMVVYLDGGAIGKAHHHYQGQAGLQKEDFYNCNKFWFWCTMDVDIYLPRQFSQNFCQLSRPSCWWLWC